MEPESSEHSASNTGIGRMWTFVRIMNVRLRFIFLMILVGVVSANWDGIMNRYDRWRRPAKAEDRVAGEAVEFYCPMHPNIVRGEPGSCPICGMPLSKRAKSGHTEMSPDALARVQLSPFKVQMGRIGTSPVEYRLLSREIRTVGIVEYAEPKRAFIAARIKGRIDKLYVNYVGQHVEKGQPLVWIYSPDLLVAQEELLSTIQRKDDSKETGPIVRQSAENLLAAARRKLILWGITEEQVEEIIKRGKPETHLTIQSPIAGIVTDKKVLEGRYVNEGDDLYTIADLSTVWLQAKVFESEISGVSIGTAVEVTSVAYPNEVFAGRVTFIAYTVDPGTRTVSARVEVVNPDLRLKPGMYVRAAIRLPVGRVEILESAASSQAASEPAVNTQSLVKAYLKLTDPFAADKADAPALEGLLKEVDALAKSVPKAINEKTQAIRAAIAPMNGKTLREQRKLFKEASARIIEFVEAHPPPDMTVSRFHCPMVKADWLGLGEDVRNPYYGSEMLDCGKVTGTIRPKAAQESERFATGYFCPIYPDRLFDEPRHCPVDNFPLKYARVEKVLAVPELAVIDTGARRVAYRETEPGVFEMIELKVGPRAGDYFPLIGGLKAGDRIATRGAFLVDAENRLNPSAAAQYFGASGGQQADGQNKQ
jgi:Cu(I)/Ag(I) efflux system membrane fusion protein